MQTGLKILKLIGKAVANVIINPVCMINPHADRVENFETHRKSSS